MEIKSNEKVSHSISRVTYEYYEEDHMAPCVYKPGISVHFLVSIDRIQLHVVMVNLTMRGFNANSVEAEGHCKQS